jgi:hypothetical protein
MRHMKLRDRMFGTVVGLATLAGGCSSTDESAPRSEKVLEPRQVLSDLVVVAIVDPPPTSFEGVTVNLSSTVTNPVGTPTYAWTVLKNGTNFATGNAVPFSFTPDDNGLYAVTLSVTDDANTVTGNLDPALTVANQVPVASVTGPTTGTSGQSLAFTLTATDVALDAVEGFAYGIDWDNDGVFDEAIPATANNGAGVGVNHTFTQLGLHRFSVIATDKDGGVSERATHDVNIIQPVSLSVPPEAVSLNGSGSLPVTVFSAADFDVATLDLKTLRLSGAVAFDSAFEDANDDGDLDLVLYFNRQDFLDEYAAALTADLADGTLDDSHQEVELVLTGQTKDGANILGVAAVELFMTGKKLDNLLGTL